MVRRALSDQEGARWLRGVLVAWEDSTVYIVRWSIEHRAVRRDLNDRKTF